MTGVSSPPRYVSGIRPTGHIHLGNYLGAIRQWLDIQDRHECVFFVADLHGSPELAEATHNTLLELGLSSVFTESFHRHDILSLQHALAPHVPVGRLRRMTQYKDKSRSEEASLSLFAYPVLMAADIFYYGGTHIPVGEDQAQHVEFARDLHDRLRVMGLLETIAHGCFRHTLHKPCAIIGNYPRIMSLTDATRKMSKSDPDDMSRINVTDSPDTIRAKIMAAKSSMSPGDDTPEARNLRTIYRALGGKKEHERWKPFKAELVELLIGEFGA